MLFQERPDPLHRNPETVGVARLVGLDHGYHHPNDPSRLVDNRSTTVARVDGGTVEKRTTVDLGVGGRSNRAAGALEFESEHRSAWVPEDHDVGTTAGKFLGEVQRSGVDLRQLFAAQQGQVGVL